MSFVMLTCTVGLLSGGWDLGWHQYTTSSHATTLESNKSEENNGLRGKVGKGESLHEQLWSLRALDAPGCVVIGVRGIDRPLVAERLRARAGLRIVDRDDETVVNTAL